MICDIDRVINGYTFFGNGGAYLHTKLSEAHQINLKSCIAFFDPQNMSKDTIIVPSTVILTEL